MKGFARIKCVLFHKPFTYRPCRRGKDRCRVCGMKLKNWKGRKVNETPANHTEIQD